MRGPPTWRPMVSIVELIGGFPHPRCAVARARSAAQEIDNLRGPSDAALMAACLALPAATTPVNPTGGPQDNARRDALDRSARDPIVFCQDYRCGHNVKLSAAQVDKWP